MAFILFGGFVFTLLIIAVAIFLVVMYIYGLWRAHTALGLKHPWYSIFNVLNIWQIVELMVEEEDDDTIPLIFGLRVPYHLFICNSIIVMIPACIPFVGWILSIALSVIIQHIFFSKLLCLLNGESCVDNDTYSSKAWLYAFFPFIFGFHMKSNWQEYTANLG